jgi:hypothetical protein
MNKKGVSTIVATILIVLLSVAAVTILWAGISPLIDKNLGNEISCINAQGKLSIDKNKLYTCWNISNDASQIRLRVERAANSPNIAGIQITIDDDGNSVSFSGLTNDATIANNELTENGKKVYNFVLDSDLTGPVKVSIAPRVNIEGEIKSCSTTNPIEVKQCS